MNIKEDIALIKKQTNELKKIIEWITKENENESK